MTHIKKAVPVGLMIDERIQNASRPHLSGKVSTDRLTEGASVSRYEKQLSPEKIWTGCRKNSEQTKKSSAPCPTPLLWWEIGRAHV